MLNAMPSLPLKGWHISLLLSLTVLNAVLNTLTGLLTVAISAYSGRCFDGPAPQVLSWFGALFL